MAKAHTKQASAAALPQAASAAPGPAARSDAKRWLDVLVAVAALIFLAPLLAAVAMAVACDSAGPVLFRQRRTGLHGREFSILKFRSMIVMENDHQVRQASRRDSRVTRVGRFLRRSSIDELPQLFNVLKGDMSLVGPRPHAVAHDRYFGDLLPEYHSRFRVRPGLTGLAQVNGLRGEIHSIEDMARRIALDNDYVEQWSLLMDIGILAKTSVLLPFQTSAY